MLREERSLEFLCRGHCDSLLANGGGSRCGGRDCAVSCLGIVALPVPPCPIASISRTLVVNYHFEPALTRIGVFAGAVGGSDWFFQGVFHEMYIALQRQYSSRRLCLKHPFHSNCNRNITDPLHILLPVE
jgi:hypothetical protein